MLLELLSDFQISIPELGRIAAKTRPVVLLTSNNSRELTEALKRRCLYLWLDYPVARARARDRAAARSGPGEAVARRLVEVVGMVRELDLKKPPSIAESIDWARALLLLGARTSTRDTSGDDVGDRQAPHRHRHGGRAGRCVACRDRAADRAAIYGGLPDGPAGGLRRPAAQLRRGAARGGRGGRHLGAARRLRRAAADRLDRREDFREALAATLAKSQEDRRDVRARVRALLLPRGRGRGGAPGDRRQGRAGGTASRRRSSSTRCAQQIAAGAARRLGGRDARPRPDGDRGVRPPRARARA